VENGLAEIKSSITGFATVSPAVDQSRGMLISTVLADEDLATNSVDVVAYALNASTGQLLWSQSLGRGAIPSGFTAATALLDGDRVYLHNPLTQTAIALNSTDGVIQWSSSIAAPEGKLSWGAGVIVDKQLILPAGPSLYTIEVATGKVLARYDIGGSMTYNSPTIVGQTLYVGNGWGWVSAIPLSDLLK
jgi:outer membrane protein assembly factor BamB